MIEKIDEGITGAEASEIIYNNDKLTENRTLVYGAPFDSWQDGFYNIGEANLNAAFIATDSFKTQVIDVAEGDRFKVTGGLHDASGSIAIIQFYNISDILTGTILVGNASGGGDVVAEDLDVVVPVNIFKMVVTSQSDFVRSAVQVKADDLGLKVKEIELKLEGTTDTVDDLLYTPAAPPRLNTGESTTSPSTLGPCAETLNEIGINMVLDTESPFKDVIPYKHVLNNTLLFPVTTKYTTTPLPVGTSALRPSVVTVSYWLKESEARAIWSAYAAVYFGLVSYDYNLIALLNDPTLVITVNNTPSIPEYTSASLKVSAPERKDGFVKIVQQWDTIVWKGSFTGSSITYFFIMNGVSNFYNAPLSVYNLTVLQRVIDPTILIYPDPTGAFSQVPANLNSINQSIAATNARLDTSASGGQGRVKISGELLYFANPFAADKDLVRIFNVSRPSTVSNNPDIDMVSTGLIAKGAPVDVGAVALKSSGDDICPAKLQSSYIGGGHGWGLSYGLTKTAHGKTFADIGSRYIDGNGVTHTIVRIVDANNIITVSDNQAVDGFTYTYAFPNGTLTYVSNGANTGAISAYSGGGLGNLYFSSLKSLKRQTLVNGNVVAEIGKTYNCDFVDLTESYDALDLPTMVSGLTANRPSGGYTSNPDLGTTGAQKLLNHTITYRLLSDGTTLIFHNFLAYKKLKFDFHGFIQAGALDTGRLYVPKILPINDTVRDYDLSASEDWTTPPAGGLFFTPDKWEFPDSPPDRVLNYNSTVNFHMGYLFDRGVGALRRADAATWLASAGFMWTSRKLYPYGVNRVYDMPANTSLSCVAFRQWTNPANNPTGRTNYGVIDMGAKAVMYLDYHASITDRVAIPENLQGRKITVDEKSTNVQILGDVATNELTVIATIDGTYKYGFAVLVFE